MDLSGTGKAASAPTGTGWGSALQRRLSVERQYTTNPFSILLGPSRLVFRNTRSQMLLDVYYTHRTPAFHLCIGRDFPVLACEGLERSSFTYCCCGGAFLSPCPVRVYNFLALFHHSSYRACPVTLFLRALVFGVQEGEVGDICRVAGAAVPVGPGRGEGTGDM